ncbi:MAG: glycosyltransferase family 4 protein [Muribaculaceae bacterium]|nr:glycosyltransferase family 4 protein [Muribaculaceae bacterium]
MSRLVVLTYDYPPNNGGIARLCREIVGCCKAEGVPCQVVTAVAGEPAQNVERITGKRGVVEWKIYRYLRENLAPGDVVLTATFHPDGLLAVLAGARNRFFLAHGAELLPGRSWLRRFVFGRYRSWLLKKASKVIANSHYTAGLVKECSPSARVAPLPLAVDNVRFHPTMPKHDDGLLHLCSISRLEKFKGHDFVIRTIASLPPDYRSRVRLEIGGKGAYKPMLERMVQDYGLCDQVHFLGFIADDELCDFYSRNHVFVLCTREEPGNRNVEGFGLVFVEAQACGTPCIATNAGGIPDAVSHGNGGWLIEQDDQEALAKLLTTLADSPELISRQAHNAINRVVNTLTWSEYFKQLRIQLGLYHDTGTAD